MKKNGIGSHQSAKMKNDEWLTPPELLQKLGEFDLDPCAPVERPWEIARNHYTKKDCGLTKNWFGRVFCNPPYGLEVKKWLKRCVEHKNAIALIFARTETKMFFDYVWNNAKAVLFIEGRLYFHYVDGSRAKANSGAPSVLVAYNKENADLLEKCNINGKFIRLSE